MHYLYTHEEQQSAVKFNLSVQIKVYFEFLHAGAMHCSALICYLYLANNICTIQPLHMHKDTLKSRCSELQDILIVSGVICFASQ